MKKLILLTALIFSTQGFALTSLDSKSGEKVNIIEALHTPHVHSVLLDSICHSTNTNLYEARQTCHEYANLLSLMSNDQLVLRGTCRPATYLDTYCRYAYGYILNVQAISFDHHH